MLSAITDMTSQENFTKGMNGAASVKTLDYSKGYCFIFPLKLKTRTLN